MTELAQRPVGKRGQPSTQRFEKRRLRGVLSPLGVESLLLFLVTFVAYVLLGARLVMGQHLVLFDGLARLSHAYFVWWNDPPKLAAIGFVWPPIETLVFLPVAFVKPIATSLLALPLTSAWFAGLMLVYLDRTLALLGLGRPYRLTLVGLFAVNPMIAFYASNGMGEMVYLAFLVGGLYYFLRWYIERRPTLLILTGTFFAIGILSRYELFTWAFVLTVVVVVALIRQHVSRDELEGSVLSYLAPISYGLFLWVFFNWLILGDPLSFLRHQLPNPAGGASTTVTGATTAGSSGSLAIAKPRPSVHAIASELASLNWHLFPLTAFALVGLLALFVMKRDVMALILAVILSLNAFFTALVIYVSHSDSYGQLRYNMRAMPIAVIGIGWICLRLRGRARLATWGAAVVVLVACLPSTWHTMRTYPNQYEEKAFVGAVSTGKPVPGLAPYTRMAAYIRKNVHAHNAILTDDAGTFAVMLFTSHPDWFLDRIDKGDVYWTDVLRSPFGRVRYMLFMNTGDDPIHSAYPNLPTNGEPGFTVVHRDDGIVLVRVAKRPPQPPRPS